MASASGNGNTVFYTYDLNGLRTSKTVNNTLHTYYYAGGRLLRETYGSNTLDFAYDASGNPFSLTYNGTKYYYVTNLQGDVFYLVDTTGSIAASYTYAPYGKFLTTSGEIAEINPLRCRGYYYDTDSGFYYLQSRYYDPNTCRFINADSYASTGQGFVGNNMFAYCDNKPITRIDALGLDSRDYFQDCCFVPQIGIAAISLFFWWFHPKTQEKVAENVGHIALSVSDIYNYAKAVKRELLEWADENISKKLPVVHHIIPHGQFSSRDPKVYEELNKAQSKMQKFGVNPLSDVNNLMVVSAGFHQKLHTNEYLMYVAKVINNAPDSKDGVINALWFLRFKIAMDDFLAAGY